VRRLIDIATVEAALDRRLDPAARAPIALALSGGGDSMALMDLTLAWAKSRGRRVLALTVDHGLNPDSAAWTAFAGAAAFAAGAEWRSLAWTGDKPSSGLPAAARLARHRLLADAAREAGASVLLLGHTADDIAESALMRAHSPAHGYLHEWSPSPVWPQGRGLFCLRPLLGVSRSALRDQLQARRLGWLDDPANDNLSFARPRARAALAVQGRSVPPARFPAAQALTELAGIAEIGEEGQISLALAALASIDAACAKRFIGMAAICASGHTAPPRGEALQRLFQRIGQGGDFVCSLAGARIAAEGDRLRFMREAGEMRRAALAPLRLHAGQTAVWDGRLEISAGVDLTVMPLAGCAARLSKADQAWLAARQAALRPSLPALFHGETMRLPAPFGAGPAYARALAGPRLLAACGLITHERDISQGAMAQEPRSSYVETLALALAHSSSGQRRRHV